MSTQRQTARKMRKQKLEENQLYEYFKWKTGKIEHKKT